MAAVVGLLGSCSHVAEAYGGHNSFSAAQPDLFLIPCWCRLGISLSRVQVACFIFDILIHRPRDHPTAAAWLGRGAISRRWFQSFLRHHPAVSWRMSEKIGHNFRAVTKE
jgi:hypothetical protein